jgi:hypothetical protein
MTRSARQNNAAGQSLLIIITKIITWFALYGFPERNPAGTEILDFAILSNVLWSHSVRTLASLPTSDLTDYTWATRTGRN